MSLKQRCTRFWRRLKADSQKGSAAIEFAFVAPVFFVLLLGIFEGGIMFFSQAALQNAVTNLARQIRTGQVANAGMTQQQFHDNICAMTTPLIPCSATLQIDVESSSSGYGGISVPDPRNSNGTLNSNLNNFSIGKACDVVLVRAFYLMPIYTPVLSWFLVSAQIPGTDGSGQPTYAPAHLVSAAAAFRNEPFTTTTGGC